ncbi:hypothetical protein GJ744_001554 [Endocarpon pusillum]|uniref:Uncharacterized protein n=1 Tax=Endocarpon pusillum TaxID=364733 RepID=A0A8H7E1T8_9EURO|nr:hypothetical protein GJ744_001554 [Endocarpon pusillum]
MQLVDGREKSWDVVREGSIQVESGTRVIRTSLNGSPESIEQYAIFQHTVHDMPQDANRHGQAESIVTLAFPQKNQKPRLEDQQTYAFLPIDHFGFQTEQTSSSSSTGIRWDAPQKPPNLLIVGPEFRNAEGDLLFK